MNFRLPYFFTIFLAGLLTLGCGSDPEPDPELTILVQPSDKNPLSEGLFVGGQNIMLTASVSHTGGPGSEATQLQFYRSDDAAVSTDDSPEGERQPVEALSSGASDDVNITVTLPSEVGSYYYGACVTLADSQEICSPGLEIIVSELTTVTPVSMTESSLPAGGSNYFRFTLPGTGTLASTQGMAIHTSGETNTTGRLYDGDGALVATNFNSGENGNFRLDRPLVSGTYFIRVSGNDMSTAGEYTLHLEGSNVTTVELGSTTERTLTAAGSDYFQFTLESTLFSSIYNSGDTDVTGRLYDSSGVPLATDFNGGDGRFDFHIRRLLAPGTYFIRVHGAFPNIAGGYTLHLEGSNVTTVELGSMTERTLTAGVSDYFQFTLESAHGMAIYTSGSTDTFGHLYDGDGLLLATNDDGGGRNNFNIDLPLNPGTYFIRVRGFALTTTGDYTLHVEGDSVTTVELGSMTDAALSADDNDYFQFTLESAQRLAIHTSGETNTTGHLYDGDGALVVTDENSGESGNFRLDRPLVSGTYFIRVSGDEMSTTGDYTLHLEGSDVTTVPSGSMTDAMLTAGVSSYFQFTLETHQRLVAIYTSGEGDLSGSLYDDDGTLLTSDADSGEGNNFRIESTLTPGTYFIEVKGADMSVQGSYTLHIIPVVQPGSKSKRILAAGANHYFQFTLESAQPLAAIYTEGGTNVTGNLYDSDGMLLTTDENSGEGNNFRIERMLAAGTYSIRVSGADTSVSGRYTLYVVPVLTPGSMTASTLTIGGNLYFQVTVESAQSLVIRTSGGTDTAGRLYDSDGVLLEDTGGGLGDFRIERMLAAGTYLIEVRGDYFSVSGDYTLHIEVETAPP